MSFQHSVPKVVQVFFRDTLIINALVFSVTGFISTSVAAQSIEEKMEDCGWSNFPTFIEKYRSVANILPAEVQLRFNRCEDRGPEWVIQTRQRKVHLQNSWDPDEVATDYWLTPHQASPDHWQFRYNGWEWAGYLWVHKITGRKVQTPGVYCDEVAYSPDNRRAILQCSPEYATNETHLYLVKLNPGVSFRLLARNPPPGRPKVRWLSPDQVSATFVDDHGKKAVRFYRF